MVIEADTPRISTTNDLAQFVSFCGHGAIFPTPVDELDADGNQLRFIMLTDGYTANKVLILCGSTGALRAQWATAGRRADVPGQLEERDTNCATVATQGSRPDADPFELLCHLAFNAPVHTHRQRADRVKRQQAALFHFCWLEEQDNSCELLETLAGNGELQFTLANALKLPAVSRHVNANDIFGNFGDVNYSALPSTNSNRRSLRREN